MYNSIPITLTVESLLSDNKGQIVICNAKPEDCANDLIGQISYLMGIESKPHHFIKFEKDLIFHGKDILGKVLGSKTVHHYTVFLDSYYVSKLRWFASVLGLLLGVSAIVSSSVLYTIEKTTELPSPTWEYGIVADGGSSHTSFLIYNWPKNHLESVVQIGECTAQDGGIDQFISNPIEIQSYLSICIKTLESDLLSMGLEDLRKARIYLGATAGMRLVNISNHDNATLVMNYIDELFANSSFYYVQGDAKILPGQEEGALSWLTTNILAGTLNNTDEQTITYGSLDMGGASMQISYECIDGPCSDNITFELYDQTFEVFSKSDLCYGLDEAMKRFVVSQIYEAYLANGRNITNEFNNPCITRGNLLRDDWLVIFPSLKGEIFDTPCTTDLKDAEFANAVKALPSTYQFFHRRASGGASDCYSAISFFTEPGNCSSLFAGSNCLKFEPEEVMTMPDLPVYFAMSSYYWEFFRYLNTSSSNVTYEFSQRRIEELCSPDFIIPEGSSVYSATDCFESAYIFNIITKGYQKFDETNFNTIFFALDINGAEVSWPLGFLVNEITQAALLKKDIIERLISIDILVILLGFGLFASFLSVMSIKNIFSKYSTFRKKTVSNKN